ncbi:MAG: GGDEF domain-containing protein [Ideonella sp.]|jgi:diguanylate cyclase (GGDEF)-like protein|nr:GGDEF domain-containing protein [Ideonella sp.]
MSALVDHLAGLTGSRDRDVVDVTLVQAIQDLLRPAACAVYRRVGEPGRLRWLTRAYLGPGVAIARSDPAWFDLDDLPPLESEPLRCAALDGGEPVQARLGNLYRCVFPVGSDHEEFGVLEVDTAAPLGSEQVRVVGSILRIYRNFHALLDYGERDMLTGLLNRKSFDDSFLKALGEAMTPGDEPGLPMDQAAGRRTAQPGRHYLGVIDIDHFKSVNDRFGHLIGDEVLLLLARLMRGSFRYRDQLYRFGGEEFVALVRCRDEEAACGVFERLRSHTEAFPFPQVGRITVSVGYTELRPHDSPAVAFERADRAVYYAKGQGRNRVCSHAALVLEGALVETEKVGGVELF